MMIGMAGHRKNYEEGVILYNAGLSLADVAEHYNVTRQAMWSILKRRGVTMRPQQRTGESNHFHRGTKANDAAQNTLEKAIQKGLVVRKTHCETCGAAPVFKNGRTGIQAHHPDYNKPLEVMWLCQKCHHEWHKNNRAVPRRERR